MNLKLAHFSLLKCLSDKVNFKQLVSHFIYDIDKEFKASMQRNEGNMFRVCGRRRSCKNPQSKKSARRGKRICGVHTRNIIEQPHTNRHMLL